MSSQQSECRNVSMYGYCEFQDKGCQYHHPAVTAKPVMRSKSFTAASVHAPVFVPKSSTPVSSPVIGSAILRTSPALFQAFEQDVNNVPGTQAMPDGHAFGPAFTRSTDKSPAQAIGPWPAPTYNTTLGLMMGANPIPGTASPKDTDQRECRNVVIYGFCRFQEQGCPFHHPPRISTPVSRPSSSLASAINAPVFVPKNPSVYSPPQTWSNCTGDTQPSTPIMNGILSDGENSLHGSEIDALMDWEEQPTEQTTNNPVELLQLLYRILLKKELRDALQNLQGYHAQIIVDYLYSVLLWPVLPTPWLRKHALIALYKLCKSSLLYPHCYILKDSIIFCSHEGGGGFSDIHKGRFGDKEFCLKVVRLHQKSDTDALLKRFAKEAILWGHLQHPNIVPFYGVYYLNELRRQICLVSPWMRHGNVVEYLRRHPSADRAPFVLDVAYGLTYLHDQDVIHSDLKGVNILVNDLGRACITDFGLSLVRTDKTFAYTVASSTAHGLSHRWAAPELLEDGAQATLASDVWAFGCVCYEIMTGLLPFHDLSEIQVLRALIKGDAPKRPDSTTLSGQVENAVWSLVGRCCQADPRIRPNCKQILSDLGFVGLARENDHEVQDDAMRERQLFWDAMRQGEGGRNNLKVVEQILSELSQNCEYELTTVGLSILIS